MNLCYAQWIQGTGMGRAIYVFDPTTFVEGEQSRQMRYRPTVDSDFSVLVELHRDGGSDTFVYRGPELICEASGSDTNSKQHDDVLPHLRKQRWLGFGMKLCLAACPIHTFELVD